MQRMVFRAKERDATRRRVDASRFDPLSIAFDRVATRPDPGRLPGQGKANPTEATQSLLTTSMRTSDYTFCIDQEYVQLSSACSLPGL